MKIGNFKKNLTYVSKALVVISILCVVLTAARVSGYMISAGRIASDLETAKAGNGKDDETVKKLLATHREVADALKKKNMFVPQPPKPNPPQCYGIIGSSAIIDGKYYKAGDKFGSAEIVAVGPKDVTILWDGKEMKLVPFSYESKFASAGRPRPTPSGDKDQKESSGTSVTVVVQAPTPMGPGGPGGGFFGMSPDDRRAMIERFRNMSPAEQERFREEQRQRFMGGGGGPGGRDRGRGGSD
jgi:hypothetical protein